MAERWGRRAPTAPHTFDDKQSAERWLTITEAEIIQGDWLDPDASRVLFREYANAWIDERPGLRPKTIELYRYLLRNHLLPTFGNKMLSAIREPQVRRWRRERLDADASAMTVAKAYRLLRAILNTATDDGLIRRNPCRIKGASVERSPERPVPTVRQVFDLAGLSSHTSPVIHFQRRQPGANSLTWRSCGPGHG